jgi:GAF domain-containing protein
MSATADQELAELRRAYEKLQNEHDTALAELQVRTASLAQRNNEYGERIEHQSATIDVLKAMSHSPGDPQPVFDLITKHAAEHCNSRAVLWEFDGTLMHFRASHGAGYDLTAQEAIISQFPAPPNRGVISGRAILEQRLIQIPDATEDTEIWPLLIANSARSYAAIPLMRAGTPIGAISMNSPIPGGFSDSQVALLQTFAEQAVIAITSAETYRALQKRTFDLQESLEYQTATSDVLKVISRSTFDLQPVLTMVAETATRLCAADQALFIRHDNGTIQTMANFGFPPEYEAVLKELGPHPLIVDAPMVGYRAIVECRVVHVTDVAAVPGYAAEAIKLGQQRTSLGVPLLRAGEPLGSILLARRRVEPFTDRQIELVNTFADQAVIAIENTRLLNEQREALEQQTATAEVLQVINSSPGNLAPVFEAMLDRAMRLCEGAQGTLWMFNGEQMRATATAGYSSELAAQLSEWREIHPFQRRLCRASACFRSSTWLRRSCIARAMRLPRQQSTLPEFVQSFSWAWSRTPLRWAVSQSADVRSAPSLTSRSHCYRTLRHKPSSPWRTHGCSPSNARRWNSRRPQLKCCR